MTRTWLLCVAALITGVACGTPISSSAADEVSTPTLLIKKDKLGDVKRETRKKYSPAQRKSVDIRQVKVKEHWNDNGWYVGSTIEVTMRGKKKGFKKRDKPSWRWGISVDMTPIGTVGSRQNPQVGLVIRSGRTAKITRWTVDGQKSCRAKVTRANKGRTYRVNIPERCIWGAVKRVDVYSWFDPIWRTDTEQLSDHLSAKAVLGQYSSE